MRVHAFYDNGISPTYDKAWPTPTVIWKVWGVMILIKR